MGNWITILMTGCFVVLCSYCYGTTAPIHYINIWRTDKAAQIADIFDISPDEIDKPINIFNQ